MGGNYNDFKEYELYPCLFDNVSRAFPSLEFKRKGNRWESKYHLDGTKDSQGKPITCIYENSKFCAIDISRDESKNLINLYISLNNCDFITALRNLAELCNLTLPESDSEDWKAYERKQQLREEANRTFVKALWGGSDKANEVLSYLRDSRKWTDEEIKRAELGLITTEIRASLEDWESYKGIVKDKDDRIVGGIGTTHLLTIPYRNGSRIFGFKFREVGADTGTKYLNSYGLPKSTGLFGIGIDVKELIIVEGELDALHAQVKGADNVAATTGGKATEAQIQDAVNRGVDKFILLFDNDQRGRAFIKPTIEAIQKTGKNILVSFLPEGCKDTDEYLTGHTIEDFYSTVKLQAVPYSSFLFGEILTKYQKKEETEGVFTHPDRIDFFNEVEKLLNSPYTQPYEREDIRRALNEAEIEQSLSFTTKEYQEWADNKYLRVQDAKREEKVREAFTKIGAAIQDRNIDEALKLMGDTSSKQSKKDKETEYAEALNASTPEELSSLLSEVKEGIPTGFTFKKPLSNIEEPFTLNAGLTFICGYRGHGKTSFLNNIALNEATRNIQTGTGKSVLYFSYEVDKRRLILDLLNTFVNDPEISANPSKTILGYFKGQDFFKKKDEYGRPTDKYKTNFIRKKDVFLRDYLSSGALTIVDANYKVEELLRAIKWYMGHKEVSIICIDYAQLLYSEDFSRQRTEEIKKVVNDIKDFANKEGIPFVMAAQFNREVDSPISVDTKNIGEGGDFERIADTCIGLFNLKELHPLPTKSAEEREALKLLTKLTGENITEAQPIQGKLFVRLMKRRYGFYPIDTILDWEGRTKYIRPNAPEQLEPKQGTLFEGEDEVEAAPF